MFDFAWSHLFLLILVAVIFLGPKELPIVLRYLGKFFAKLQQQKEEIREYIEATLIPEESPKIKEQETPKRVQPYDHSQQ